MTIKVPESKRYAADNPWLTIKGTDVDSIRESVIKSMGMNPDEQQGLSLFDVVVNAQTLATKIGGTAQSLGGTVLPTKSSGSTESASATAPAAEPEGPHPLFGLVESQTSVTALQRLWAENKANFDADAALMDAYKAKGKALTLAGSA